MHTLYGVVVFLGLNFLTCSSLRYCSSSCPNGSADPQACQEYWDSVRCGIADAPANATITNVSLVDVGFVRESLSTISCGSLGW